MKFKHLTIYLNKPNGIEWAERLQRLGWKIIASSPDVLQFEKKIAEEN